MCGQANLPVRTFQLFVVCRVVGKRFAALRTRNRATPTTCATSGTGIMPHTGCILGRLRCFGRVGGGCNALRQGSGTDCRRRGCCWSGRVVGCVVDKRGAAFCASGGSASPASTAFWAGVVPNARCILGRLRFGRGCRVGIGHGSRGGGVACGLLSL